MNTVFQKIIDDDFSDFKGLTADLSIPVAESIINEIIEAALRGNKNIESCRVSIHKENRASANLRTKALPWALNLKFKLDKSVDLASYSAPKLRMWLENNQLLGTLGSFLNVLPEGVKLYGNQVVVDLGTFLRTPEQKRLLDLVKSVGIKTEEGKIILDVRGEVN
jgi:hypothetical protein